MNSKANKNPLKKLGPVTISDQIGIPQWASKGSVLEDLIFQVLVGASPKAACYEVLGVARTEDLFSSRDKPANRRLMDILMKCAMHRINRNYKAAGSFALGQTFEGRNMSRDRAKTCMELIELQKKDLAAEGFTAVQTTDITIEIG
jgi:hypothetical protein